MLSRRIVPCLDVRDGQVVKGVRFRDHVVMGAIEDLIGGTLLLVRSRHLHAALRDDEFIDRLLSVFVVRIELASVDQHRSFHWVQRCVSLFRR